MRKVYDSKTYAHIYSPDKIIEDSLARIEIARSQQPAGYVFSSPQKSTSILHYVISGSFYYNGAHYTAPAMIIMFYNGSRNYVVDDSCNDFFSYYIKCESELLYNLMRDVGVVFESSAFHCDHMEEVVKILRDMTLEESYEKKNETLYMLCGLFKLLSIYTGRYPKTGISSVSVYTKRILEYIHAHYNTQITEKDMATLVNLSTNYMHKIFLSDMKLTPIYYLNQYRIKQAKKLLSDTDLPIARIADKVGISGGDYFCRVFRKYTGGISPTEYRKKSRNRIISNN